jgi:hypothetical protein
MDLLIQQGWKNFYTCTTCSRFGPVQHWSSTKFPEYEIRVRTRRNTFTVWAKNMQIYGPAWNYSIESVLKQFNIYNEVVS